MQEYLYNLATDKHKGFIAGVIKLFLFILSLLYGLIVSILILFSRLKPYRLNCKVISVGNITLGGTGKTSLVEYIARHLKQQGHKVAIISRGYKKKTKRYPLNAIRYEEMGDEPYMLYKNLGDIPVLVDSDRIRAARKAIKDYSADTVILDDAFQQWGIIKDLDIVTVDATNPFGNRRLIPRGILREPVTSLKRADIVILTKTNLQAGNLGLSNYLKRINPLAVIYQSIHKPIGFYKINKPRELLSPQDFKGKPVTLFSGIGDPASFENLVSSLGIKIGLSFRFRDHNDYTQSDLDNIAGDSQNKGINIIVTTEKDAARLEGLNCGLELLVLRITPEIKDEQGFHSRLHSLYSL